MAIKRLLILIIGLLIVFGFLYQKTLAPPAPPVYPQVILKPDNWLNPTFSISAKPTNSSPASTNSQRLERMRMVRNIKRQSDLTEEEKADMAKKFTEKFKPAVSKWIQAYEGRIPFKADKLTLDKFYSRLGNNPDRYQYTFMVDGYTLVLIDDWPEFARVFYFADPQAMSSLNSRPGGASAPDITVPINRTDILRMTQADTGVSYQPNQVTITPSGASSALAGGAIVDVNKEMVMGGAGEVMNGKSINLVFDSNGNLVSYEGPSVLENNPKK